MRLTVVASLCLLLAACQTTAVPASLPIPDPDPRMLNENYCGRGDARIGDDVIVAGRRKENARACEHAINNAWRSYHRALKQASEQLGQS